MAKQKNFRKYTKKDIPLLKYGILHSQFGYPDGVSIVMKQIEEVIVEQMHVPKKNIFYLIGRSKIKGKNITIKSELWVKEKTNMMMQKYFEEGFGGDRSRLIEKAIDHAQSIIEQFIEKNKIDVIIAHNKSHPVNFVFAVALHRFYNDRMLKGKKTPKYILWWHDSHLERKTFSKPAADVYRYLLQGVPGRFVEYIIFINSTQFPNAESYFKKLDEIKPGYFETIGRNHSVVYNTTNTFINSYEDLESDKLSSRVDLFLEDFKIKELLTSKGLELTHAMFCLQHTRLVHRKRIDFALKYCFELFKQLQKKRKMKIKIFYFLVSGHSADNTKAELKRLYKKLCEEYKTDNFSLIFAEDYKKTTIKFEEYPLIFAKLKGITTYFSEIEGFGNNLLEVLASGLIPVIYTYPIFKTDIAKYGFKVIALDKFEIEKDSIDQTIDIIRRDHKRRVWVNKNLKILKKHFPHKIIAMKLKRAIIRRRTNI